MNDPEARQRADDLAEVIDEFVDYLSVDRLEEQAERLEVTVETLLDGIRVEALARIKGSA